MQFLLKCGEIYFEVIYKTELDSRLNNYKQDFPGGPVVKTPSFQCRGVQV